MKKTILSTLFLVLTITIGYSQSNTNEIKTTFGVRGNCGMCKATIEKAVKNLNGISSAIWDKDKKKIDISYDASKTNIMEIHNAITASGYDTEMSSAEKKVYENLPSCCQYDRKMKMNKSVKNNNHLDHKH